MILCTIAHILCCENYQLRFVEILPLFEIVALYKTLILFLSVFVSFNPNIKANNLGILYNARTLLREDH